MQLGDQELEKLFKDNLEEKQMPMDEHAWEQMKPLLKERRKKRGAFWLWFPIGMIVLFAMGYLFGIYGNENSLEHKQNVLNKTAANNENSNGAEQTALNKTEVSQENAKTNQMERPIESTIKSEKLKGKTGDKMSVELTKESAVPSNLGLDNEGLLVEGKERSNSAKNKEIISPGIITVKHKTKAISSTLENPFLAKKREPFVPVGGILKRGLISLNAIILEPQFDSKIMQIIEDTTPPVSKVLKWSVGIYSGLSHNLNSKPIQVQRDKFTMNLEAKQASLFGFQIKCEFKKVGLSLGLEYQKYRFNESLLGKFEQIERDTVYEVVTKTRVIDGRNYWVIDERISTQVNQSSIQYLNGTKNSVTYLQFPLQVSYRLQPFTKLAVIPFAGTRVNIPVNANAFLLDKSTSVLNELKHSDLKTSANLLVGLSLQYAVFPKWSIGLNSRFINNFRIQNSLGENPDRVQVTHTLSLNYILGR